MKLGQNFLIEGSIARKMVELASVNVSDTIVEIGPGMGMITREILKVSSNVSVVEKDGRLFDYLQSKFWNESMHMIHGDALDYPLAKVKDPNQVTVISNPPYSIIGPWLAAVLKLGIPKQMILLVQKEVGERLCAESRTKAYGALSIRLQAAYDISIEHRVAPQCFFPVPEVDSVIINLGRRAGAHRFEPVFSELMQTLFTKRRKQIGSHLKSYVSELNFARWLQILGEHNLDMTARPEEIAVPVWIRLDEQTRAT